MNAEIVTWKKTKTFTTNKVSELELEDACRLLALAHTLAPSRFLSSPNSVCGVCMHGYMCVCYAVPVFIIFVSR